MGVIEGSKTEFLLDCFSLRINETMGTRPTYTYTSPDQSNFLWPYQKNTFLKLELLTYSTIVWHSSHRDIYIYIYNYFLSWFSSTASMPRGRDNGPYWRCVIESNGFKWGAYQADSPTLRLYVTCYSTRWAKRQKGDHVQLWWSQIWPIQFRHKASDVSLSLGF